MADEQQTGTENTETQKKQIQEQTIQEEPQYRTQDEFDAAFARRLTREKKILAKQYEGIDPDEARLLKQEKEQQAIEMQKKNGEFDKIIKEQAEKKDSEINSLRSELTKTRIDDALIKVASDLQAIKPNQVVNLLKDKVRLSDDGKPEIIGDNNAPTYNDKGEPLTIDEYVGKFLDDNPHFKIATPSGAGSKSSIGGETPKPLNLAGLNMNDPEDKARYAEYRKEKMKNF